MNSKIIIGLCLIGIVLAARFDSLNIDDILGNERVLQSYIKCMLEEGPCTPEGKDFKTKLPEIIQNLCAECTDDQKAMIRKGGKYILEKKPEEWKKLADKFDPEGTSQDKIKDFLYEGNPPKEE